MFDVKVCAFIELKRRSQKKILVRFLFIKYRKVARIELPLFEFKINEQRDAPTRVNLNNIYLIWKFSHLASS